MDFGLIKKKTKDKNKSRNTRNNTGYVFSYVFWERGVTMMIPLKAKGVRPPHALK